MLGDRGCILGGGGGFRYKGVMSVAVSRGILGVLGIGGREGRREGGGKELRTSQGIKTRAAHSTRIARLLSPPRGKEPKTTACLPEMHLFKVWLRHFTLMYSWT